MKNDQVWYSLDISFVGVHELPVAVLQRPQPGMLVHDIKLEWVKVLRDRLRRNTTLQTVLPVVVNPGEVTITNLVQLLLGIPIKIII